MKLRILVTPGQKLSSGQIALVMARNTKIGDLMDPCQLQYEDDEGVWQPVPIEIFMRLPNE